MITAYLSGFGAFLPNLPVDNDRIEQVLGKLCDRSTQVKRWVLEQNGIQTRHYALDPATQRPTHTNVAMTTAAIQAALADAGLTWTEMDCLACGTSSPDQFLPNHAVMVHGALGGGPLEVASTSGVCCSGMTALKYALMNVNTGQARNAVSTGSELASASLRAGHFAAELNLQRSDNEVADLARQPMLAFGNEFLRWMLSDGAGAWVVTDRPRRKGVSLRVDWLDIVSFAHEADSCMYYGAAKRENGELEGMRMVDDPEALIRGGYLSLCQDVEVLQKNLSTLARKACVQSAERHALNGEDVDWFLPHYSSEAFRQPFYDELKLAGAEIPWSKWFTNLRSRGNTGSASIYIMLEELVASGRVKPGDRMLCFVPESSRFTFAILHLTAVS
jgi:3-oxoacyl-[acyl-carrier-protein] synthase-3